MALNNTPNNYIDIDAAELLGTKEAPATFEFTLASTPNRMIARIAARTLGNPANLQTLYTPGDTLTFTAPGVEDSVQWVDTTNLADKVGKYQAFAWVKDASLVQAQFACRAELDVGSSGSPQVGQETVPRFSHLSSVEWELVPLGRFEIPTPAPASITWRFVARRIAGTANVLVDRLFVVPDDESYVVLDWTATSDVSASSSKTFTIDTAKLKAWWGAAAAAPLAFAKFQGRGLYLKPGLDHRITVAFSTDQAWPAKEVPRITASPFAASNPVEITYKPTYLNIR